MTNRYELIVFDVSGTLVDNYYQPFEGIENLINKIHNSGYQLALATNLSQGGVLNFLNKFACKNVFISTATATECEHKPHPDMINQIILETSIDVSKVLMVGDASADIYMAHNAKINSCAVCWNDCVDKHELELSKPTYLINTIEELENLLQL